MPRLIAFLICEKIVVSKDDTPTIVSVVQTVKTALMSGQSIEEIPANAVAPFQWAMFSVWDFEESQIGMEFHQKTEMTMPDGSISEHGRGDLPFTAKKGLNFNYINIFGFPVGLEGVLTVRTWLESNGRMLLEQSYPINVERMSSPPTPDISVKH